MGRSILTHDRHIGSLEDSLAVFVAIDEVRNIITALLAPFMLGPHFANRLQSDVQALADDTSSGGDLSAEALREAVVAARMRGPAAILAIGIF